MSDKQEVLHVCSNPPKTMYGENGGATKVWEIAENGLSPWGVPGQPGQLWMTVMGEHECQINFCPFCGFKAKKQIGE